MNTCFTPCRECFSGSYTHKTKKQNRTMTKCAVSAAILVLQVPNAHFMLFRALWSLLILEYKALLEFTCSNTLALTVLYSYTLSISCNKIINNREKNHLWNLSILNKICKKLITTCYLLNCSLQTFTLTWIYSCYTPFSIDKLLPKLIYFPQNSAKLLIQVIWQVIATFTKFN